MLPRRDAPTAHRVVETPTVTATMTAPVGSLNVRCTVQHRHDPEPQAGTLAEAAKDENARPVTPSRRYQSWSMVTTGTQ
jgi:hypothetical protein